MHLTQPTIAPPSITWSTTALPGNGAITQLVQGLTEYGFFAALIGMVIGAALWALGHHSSNYQQSSTGRKGVLISAGAAMLIGAAPTLVTFFFNLGRGLL